MQTLSIVIPAYNERPTILSILSRVLQVDLSGQSLAKQVVIVDDCSRDGTRELVEELGRDFRSVMVPALERRGIDPKAATRNVEFRAELHPSNRGKSAALRTGFRAATGDFILVQDADLEYDPNDYPRLLQPLLNGMADVVYGSRFAGAERRVHMFWHTVGNKALTTVCNAASNLALTDMETCYKVFRADVIKGLKLESNRFGFEPEVTIKLAKMRYRIYEVPIKYHGRTYEAGKKIGWRDAVEAMWCIAKYSMQSDFVEGAILEETLQKMSGMRHFNEHLFETLKPWIGSRIVEAGSGPGNITDYLLRCGEVTATDVEEDALRRLREAYGDYDNVRVARWDMQAPFRPPADTGPTDTVVCINVLEHIEDDRAALANARKVLEQANGRLVLLVPAHQALYSPLDEQVGHFRRYSQAGLREVLTEAGYDIEHVEWFNLLGFFGWWLNGRVLGRDRLPVGQLALFKALSRYWLEVEKRTMLPVGLSLIAVARPKSRSTRAEGRGSARLAVV